MSSDKISVIAGIDYSMSCPAITISQISDQDSFSFSTIEKTYFMTNVSKYVGSFMDNKIVGLKLDEYSDNQERYDSISNRFLTIMRQHKVDSVAIEGYSYGSSVGLAFNIAENCGLLKHKMWLNRLPFSVYAPSAIKKFAAQKGNANKDLMYESFVGENNIDIKNSLCYTKTKIDSPIGDIVDSYYICKLHNFNIFNQTLTDNGV